MKKIQIGIVGYGNLGRGLECAIAQNEDMELAAVFTRRDPKSLGHEKAVSYDDILQYKDKIDVLVLALGSATDVPEMAPELSKHFNTVDCYDNHHRMSTHYQEINQIAQESQHTAMIATGWDPGLFSLNRLMAETILPQGLTFTFWGKGVSQGHSDAVRRIEGVSNAVQYTVPKEEILNSIRDYDHELPSHETHDRVVYVVAEENADRQAIETAIVTMPDYFEDYHTTVNFISLEEFQQSHTGMPHGGHVIRVGNTDPENREVIDYTLELDSNPQFTAAVAIAAARAIHRFHEEGRYGALTIFDTPPAYYSTKTAEELVGQYL